MQPSMLNARFPLKPLRYSIRERVVAQERMQYHETLQLSSHLVEVFVWDSTSLATDPRIHDEVVTSM